MVTAIPTEKTAQTVKAEGTILPLPPPVDFNLETRQPGFWYPSKVSALSIAFDVEIEPRAEWPQGGRQGERWRCV